MSQVKETVQESWKEKGLEPSIHSMQELVLKRIRLLCRRRIAWLRHVWSEITQDKEGPFNAHTEVDGYLYDLDLPVLESEWLAQDAPMKELARVLEAIEEILMNDPDSRLNRLASIFGLSQIEMDMVQACLALSIDPNLGRVFAYLQDNSARGYVSEPLVARLFGHGLSIILSADAPIKTWGLIKETASLSGEPARLECDSFIKNWLLGADGMDEHLNGYTTLQPVKAPLQDWPVEKTVDFIQRMVNDELLNKLRIFVSGAEGSGRKTFASIVCQQLGLSLLSINTNRIPENNWPDKYTRAHRMAWLSDAAIAWYGTGILEKYWPKQLAPFYLQFVIGEADDFVQPVDGIIDLRIELPVITLAERYPLWKQFVPASGKWEKSALNEMITRHQSTIGQIVGIGQKKMSGIEEAYLALRADTGHRLGSLAQAINSDFIWDDLVVSEFVKKGLEDFTFEATERIYFWEQPIAKRLFPQGKGLVALFTGSPGTGKTMAAQVIANALKLDLFRIDLSSVVSKYIGESSKNIQRILSRAKEMNVVLFFDEADALFGKRTDIKDAHDRYANTDTNYLLQAIEEYPDIIILASNKKANIDTGFMRRIRYLLNFPKPDASQRLLLWRGILKELTDKKTAASLDADLTRLSQLIEITGAQIKLSILSALFMARRDKTPIQLSHLVRGLERELIKEGRGLGKQLQLKS